MLLYLCFFILFFLCFVWKKKNCFKGVSIKKKASFMYTLAIYLCLVLLFSVDLFYSSDASAFINFIWGICIMFVHIFFFNFYRLF